MTPLSNLKPILFLLLTFSLFSFLLFWFSIKISDNATFFDESIQNEALIGNQYADIYWAEWNQRNGNGTEDESPKDVLNDNEPWEDGAHKEPKDKQEEHTQQPDDSQKPAPPISPKKKHKAKNFSLKLNHFPWVQRRKNLPEPKLIVATLAYNQANFLREWIEFHLMQGVDLIVVFDHGSTDNTYNVLRPYIDRHVVDWIKFPAEYRFLEVGAKFKFLSDEAEISYRNWRKSCLSLNSCMKSAIVGDNAHTTSCLQRASLEVGTSFECVLRDICQKFAFNLLLNTFREAYPESWISFLDVSEFSFVHTHSSELEQPLKRTLLQYQKQSGHSHAIMMHPLEYGANGQATVSSGEMVVELFPRHAALSTPTVAIPNMPVFQTKLWILLKYSAFTSVDNATFSYETGHSNNQPEILLNRYLINPAVTMFTKSAPVSNKDKESQEKQWVREEEKRKQLTECLCERALPLLPKLLKRLDLGGRTTPKVTPSKVDCQEKCTTRAR
uniref:Glycosyltransferase family 92 protein n=1 Tax=Percolomonas cosmopolitus TaxID=63605 RepID=A0A7S1PJ02_9EUKA|mmetsp:Transcript_9316/g.34468  ORF Transcript_9316/g.34468 Transcript_9316/m.34468 type:complete len:499 (+) Transcript_9316:2-1498(+)